MIWLAGHVAQLPSWMTMTIDQESLDLAPGGVRPTPPPPPRTTQELLELFDKNIAAARAALAKAGDEHLAKTWTLLSNGVTILKMPRSAVLRTVVMNHIIHHRAQLTVYLRMNDVPVPGLYGPSADEGKF